MHQDCDAGNYIWGIIARLGVTQVAFSSSLVDVVKVLPSLALTCLGTLQPDATMIDTVEAVGLEGLNVPDRLNVMDRLNVTDSNADRAQNSPCDRVLS